MNSGQNFAECLDVVLPGVIFIETNICIIQVNIPWCVKKDTE